jgi:hypothetical protein
MMMSMDDGNCGNEGVPKRQPTMTTAQTMQEKQTVW